MKESFWLGHAPFCDVKETDCQRTPGYKCVEKDKKGDGMRCWKGNKVKCRWDPVEFKKSDLYQYLMAQNDHKEIPGLYRPDLKWFGTAPYCAPNDCDLASKGYVPVGRDDCGDGFCCTFGEKILGMKPVLKAQQEQLEKTKKTCAEKRKEQMAMVAKAIQMVATAVV